MKNPTEYGAAYVKLRKLVEKHPLSFTKIVCDSCNVDGEPGFHKAERVAWLRTGLELVEAVHGPDHPACIEFLEWLAVEAEPKEARALLLRMYPLAVKHPDAAAIPHSHHACNVAQACFALGLKQEGFEWVLCSPRDDLERGTDSYWQLDTVDDFLAHLEGTNHDAGEWFALEAELLKRDGKTLPADVLAKREARKAVDA